MAVFGIELKGKNPLVGLAFGLAVGGALFLLANWQWVEPRQKEIARQRTKLQELNRKIQEGRAAEQKLPQFRDEVRRLELELEKLLRILPARRRTPDLIRRVRALAEQGDFDLQVFDPGTEVQKDFYSEWPINVRLAGNYHNLALFFDRISRFPRVLNIEELRIQGRRRQSDARTIDASFVAKTFVYKEPEQPEGEAAPAQSQKPAPRGKAPAKKKAGPEDL
ncbi:MAG TPA: type 4a pilus biogenesis protein PilO [Thermoanaerobaculia bacterium]|nr:type 4a pilus biogenesis protein PilO [Thermoanaerobaculia bacterium]